MSVPATPGGSYPTSDSPAEQAKNIHTAENGSRSTNENMDQAPSSDTADRDKNDKNPEDVETKPIKPFKPSEEIAAEQAVDYPVDI